MQTTRTGVRTRADYYTAVEERGRAVLTLAGFDRMVEVYLILNPNPKTPTAREKSGKNMGKFSE